MTKRKQKWKPAGSWRETIGLAHSRFIKQSLFRKQEHFKVMAWWSDQFQATPVSARMWYSTYKTPGKHVTVTGRLSGEDEEALKLFLVMEEL